MNRNVLLGVCVTFLCAGMASAITMTPTVDKRFISADVIGVDDESSSPALFAPFEDSVNAQGPSRFLVVGAAASQRSSIGPLSMMGQGAAAVNARFGPPTLTAQSDQIDFPTIIAEAESNFLIAFTLDEDAVFDLTGSLASGGRRGMAAAQLEYDNGGGFVTLFGKSVDGGDAATINEHGILSAGDYILHANAYAKFDLDIFDRNLAIGLEDQIIDLPEFNNVGQYDVKLKLSAVPEPLTASLSLLGVGGLMFATRRRRG